MERYPQSHALIPGKKSNPFIEINLSELQKSLDAQGIEIVDNQKENVIGRKALADKTKGDSGEARLVFSPV
jgi:hypothetical protein